MIVWWILGLPIIVVDITLIWMYFYGSRLQKKDANVAKGEGGFKMKVFWFECLHCKIESKCEKAIAVFNEGCPLCGSKRIKLLGHVEE